MKIKVYGSRGSMPFFSAHNRSRGGNTTCVRLDTGGHTVILDCGSGLTQLDRDLREQGDIGVKLDILIGHLHLDHIIGLSSFSPLYAEGGDIRIFTKPRGALPLSKQIFGVFSPPYWPVDLSEANKAELVEIREDCPFALNDGITVTPFKSAHPNDTTAFRIEAEGKVIVYLLDCEVADSMEYLLPYCENADLIIFDAAYLPKDYEKKRGWGHSTCEQGFALAERARCKKMLFTHFAQDYSDDTLETLAQNTKGDTYLFACDGMEFLI